MVHLVAFVALTAALTGTTGSHLRRSVPGPQAPVQTATPAPPDESAPVLGGCSQRLQDGSFELGAGAPVWQQTSTNFGTPLCTFAACGNGAGTAGPRTGSWWSWFGGIDVFEQASLTQSFTFPAVGTARLRFHVWTGARSGLGDILYVQVDGQAVAAASGTAPTYDAGYTLVERDITFMAAPGSHQIRFDSTTYGANVAGDITNFNVDDVSIEWCPLPSIAVSDPPPAVEGDAVSAVTTFTVSLSLPTSQPVTVSYATAAPPSGFAATPVEDYTPVAGTITIPPGSVSATVDVVVRADTLDEHDEALALVLSAPVNATLADPTGVVTIVDDDPLPAVSVGDATVAESGVAALPLTLTPASGRAVTVSFTTADGSATAGSDYAGAPGIVTFPAGSVQAALAVPILADAADEVDETFTATITADFAFISEGQGEVTIDDDDGPGVRIADRAVTEQDAGTTSAAFDVTLSAPSVQPIVLSYATADGTATAGADYAAAAGTITFPPGSTARTVSVDVSGDTADEPNETFQVLLSNVVDATPADPTATGFILDDDGGVIALAGELSHGAALTSDLASAPAPARHLYLLARPARSSWEVMVDAASGDLGTGQGPSLSRLAPDLSTVLQASLPVGTGPARRLSIVNASAAPVTDYVEVRSAGCSTDCGADDVYRVTARETTLAAARFNNGGSQVTVLVLQERAGTTVQGTIWFWSASGSLLGSQPFGLGNRGSLVLVTSTVSGVAGQGGSITVTHDAPYGGLTGKTVALDPTAGFSFDTPLEPRLR